jgi:hypothetical protein
MNFDLYSKYYDLLYSDKDYFEESKYVYDLLTKYSDITINSLLELGGGSGSHAYYLSDNINFICGVELSSSMVELASKRNISNYQVKQGDICKNQYPNQKFDCAVSLFHVISYLNTNEQIISCFTSVNEQLCSGSLFLFDIWYTPAVYSLKPETRIKKIENNEIKVVRIAQSDSDYKNSIVDVNYSIFIEDLKNNNYEVIDETHKMRHFTSNEIKIFAEICGFDLIASEELLTKKEPSNDTWGVMFVLKKK